MAGAFDDLVPNNSAAPAASATTASSGAFDDLIPATSKPSYATGVARQASNAIPIIGPLLNRGDAALGAIPMPFFGPTGSQKPTFAERYAENLAEQDAMDKQFSAANPISSGIANVGGALGGTLAGGALLDAAAPAAEIGSRMLGTVGSLPGRMIQGGLGGATIGAADAAVKGETPEGGAVAGAAFGAGGPLVGAAAAKAVHAIGNAITPPLADIPNISPAARAMLLKAAQDATPDAIAAGQQRVGPHGFLGDLTPELTDLTGSVADNPGTGKGIIRQAYNVRDTNPPTPPGGFGPTQGPRTRINQAVTEAFGPQTNIVQTTAADLAARAANADPLYAAWRATPVPMTPELSAIANLPSVQRALPAAQRMAGDEGQAFLDANGNPTAQTWDYVKRAMDDATQSAGYGTNEARISGGIARRITDAMDNHPDPNVAGVWQQARQAWANPTAVLNAREYGQTVFSRNLSADQVADDLAHMSAPEQAAVIEGSRSQVQNMIDASTRGDTTARNIMLAPANQQKLAAIVGQPRADALTQSMQNEIELKGQSQNIVGGSQTTPKAARLPLAAPPPSDSGFLGWWNKFSPVDRPASILPAMRQGFQNDQYAAARAQLAPLLTSSGATRDALADQLIRGAGVNAGNAARAQNINDLATILMAGPGAAQGRRMIAPQNIQLLPRQ
jgi:hypothetical protein